MTCDCFGCAMVSPEYKARVKAEVDKLAEAFLEHKKALKTKMITEGQE